MEIKDLNKGFKQIEDRLRKELAKSDGTKTKYTESDVINNCIDMIFSLKHILNNKIESGEDYFANKKRPTPEEIKELSKPFVDILYKYYHPHAIIMISQSNTEIVEGDMSVPNDLRD